MQHSVSVVGGATIYYLNAPWPFARLKATPRALALKVWLFGTFTFAPEQVVTLEKYVSIPYFGWGLRINHIVPNYPEKIMFWYWGRPEKLINKIENIGFSPTGLPSVISYEDESYIKRALKTPILIGVCVLCFILLLTLIGFLLPR